MPWLRASATLPVCCFIISRFKDRCGCHGHVFCHIRLLRLIYHVAATAALRAPVARPRRYFQRFSGYSACHAVADGPPLQDVVISARRRAPPDAASVIARHVDAGRRFGILSLHAACAERLKKAASPRISRDVITRAPRRIFTFS